jgi:hypothetical protein
VVLFRFLDDMRQRLGPGGAADEAHRKRLIKRGGKLALVSDNPHYAGRVGKRLPPPPAVA